VPQRIKIKKYYIFKILQLLLHLFTKNSSKHKCNKWINMSQNCNRYCLMGIENGGHFEMEIYCCLNGMGWSCLQ